MLNMVCAGCGRPFQHRKVRKYCSWSCRTNLTEWTQAQIRFHIFRAGGRGMFQKYLGLNARILAERFHIAPIDKLRQGQMVNIAGILAKRCPCCEVTWPLEKFYAQDRNASGVAGPCESCRVQKKVMSDKEVVY